MTTLNTCVQEFINRHSSTLFSSDNTDTHRPRVNRFSSISSPSNDIEDEDPNLFVITPPIEYFLRVSSRLCREQFFKLIRPGHLLICNILTASSRDMLVRILCFDDGRRRVLHDLKLTATCLLNTSSMKNNNNNRKRNKYDRDIQEISDEDDADDGEYQSGDFIRACVSHVDVHKEEIQLSIDQSTNQRHHSSKKLGLINEEDLPTHYVLLRRQEDQPQSYEDILQTSKAFTNRACVQTLYQRLKQRYEHLNSETNNTESPSDILHTTLINSFKRKQIPTDEYFNKLRQKQDHEWAMESVAEGIRLMKEDRSTTAVLHFNKALTTDPKCVDAFVARGALSANQGHYKRAMQDFEDALKIDRNHMNALKYLHDVLNNIANSADDYDEAIHYLEKALKYKPDDNETKRKMDILRAKKKEVVRKLEYGPSLPSSLQTSSKVSRLSRTPTKRSSSVKGSSSIVSFDNGSKRKRSSSSTSSTDSSSSSSRSSSSSTSSTTSHSLSTISSSSLSDTNDKKMSKAIPVIDITESDLSATTRSSTVTSSSDKSKRFDTIDLTTKKSTINENNNNGNSLTHESIIISKISRLHSNDHSSKSNQLFAQRKTLPSTIVSSSSTKQQQVSSSTSSKKKNTSVIIDREAEDIEKLYMELKAKHSIEKRKK